MRRKYIRWIVGALVLLVLAGVMAYQFTGGSEYSTDMRALRSEFNSDKGKVRLLVLLSPT